MSDNTTFGDLEDAQPSPRRHEPDAHGQAALLLSESILHTLLEQKLLSASQAIEVVRSAADVKSDIADDMGETYPKMQRSIALLTMIEQSLELDVERNAAT